MNIIRSLRINLLAFFLLVLPSVAASQVTVTDAEWTSVSNFKFCGLSGNCETFRMVELSANSIETNSIEIGQDISVINLETGMEITKFLVKSIKYGRQVKMCWIGDSEGLSETYITVSGCKR